MYSLVITKKGSMKPGECQTVPFTYKHTMAGRKATSAAETGGGNGDIGGCLLYLNCSLSPEKQTYCFLFYYISQSL